jgi:hypothetical protein
LTISPRAKGAGQRIMQPTDTERTAADLDAAYTEFTSTTEGTPEYHRALENFISLLFPNGKPPLSEEPISNLPVNLPRAHESTVR